MFDAAGCCDCFPSSAAAVVMGAATVNASDQLPSTTAGRSSALPFAGLKAQGPDSCLGWKYWQQQEFE